MAITSILSSTIILNEGAISATATMPSIPAGSNRVVIVTFSMYNGGGTSLPPTAVTANGVSATLIEGDTTAQSRTTTSSWFFKESDVASITGQTLTSSAGVLGTQKSITVEAYSDAAQTKPTNTVKDYLSASGSMPMSLTRVANSRTIVKSFTSASATALNFTDPTRTGTSNFTSRWMSYASTADTARTTNVGVTGVNFTSAHAFNIEPFPTGTIDTINGGSYNPVKAGSSGNTVTVTGFTPTSGTLGGKAISSLTSTGGGGYTFTTAAYTDGGTYPEPDTTQVFTLTDGSASPTANTTLSSPNGMTSVVVSSPITDDNRYVPYWMKIAGYDPVNGDRFVYTTSDCVISANGAVSASSEVTTVIWLWQASGTITRSFTMRVGSGGVSTNYGIASIGLTSVGIAKIALTA